MNIREYLKEKGTSKMGDIALLLNLSMSAATSIVDKMIDMKLLKRERSSDDRRVVIVELDDKGKATADQIMEDRKKCINDIFSVLEDKERKEYLRLITKVYDNLGDL